MKAHKVSLFVENTQQWATVTVAAASLVGALWMGYEQIRSTAKERKDFRVSEVRIELEKEAA